MHLWECTGGCARVCAACVRPGSHRFELACWCTTDSLLREDQAAGKADALSSPGCREAQDLVATQHVRGKVVLRVSREEREEPGKEGE